MDAKEKAKELVEAMTFSCRECDYDAKAKQSALICVNQIEDAIDFDWMQVQNLESQHRYWQKVKEEIEKL